MNNMNINDYYNIMAHSRKMADNETPINYNNNDDNTILNVSTRGMIGIIGEVNNDTYQELLSKSKGKYIICELLIGVDSIVIREGVLTEVGPNYFTLFDSDKKLFTVCDLYSLKFITLFPTDRKPTNEEYNKWLDNTRREHAGPQQNIGRRE